MRQTLDAATTTAATAQVRWRYPAYRESGVPWLGQIPAQWEVKPLKRVAVMNPGTLAEDTNPDLMIAYLDIANVASDGAIGDVQEISFGQSPSRARRTVHDGDTILSTVRTYLRAIAYMDGTAQNLVVSTGFAVLRPQSCVYGKFLWRLVQSEPFVQAIVANSEGVGYPAISSNKLAGLLVWLPPLDEQRAIAAFLDRETARLDALVAKKERLIALLQEKRAAVISHTVMRGLDPTAPMKDSGVEWLGRIRATWEVRPIWMIGALGRGRVISTLEIQDNPGPYPVYSSQTEDDGVLGYLATFEFEGTYLTWTTDGANAGTVFYREGKFNCTNVCGTIKPRGDVINLKYLGHALNLATSWYVRHDINPKLMNNVMARIRMPLPSRLEQDRIAEQLEYETAKINALISKIRQHIERVREYRAALISAAVMGKIDVRDRGVGKVPQEVGSARQP